MAILPVGIGPQEGGYQIERSLRFNSADSAYLNRTFGTPTSNTTWTFSCWLKRGDISVSGRGIFSESTGYAGIYFTNGDILRVMDNAGGVAIQTTAVYRDPSAWAHLVVRSNGTNIKAYWNSVEVGSYNGTITLLNAATSHHLGRYSSSYFNGYLTEINFIDGQALDPTSFGEYNTDTGVWQPIAYEGTYGTNGFYLNFSDNSGTTSTTLGKDYSGNSNNWTPNNFSVTAGAGNDSLVDTPTNYGTDTGVGGEVRGNYATLNPLNLPKGGTLANGNLQWTAPSAEGQAVGTMYVSSGKWYWEVVQTGTSGGCGFGIAKDTTNINSTNLESGAYVYYSNGNKYNASTPSSYGASFTTNDVIGVALDLDAGTLTFYKNGTSQGQAFSGLSGNFSLLIYDGTGAATPVYVANFGQLPFAYTAPSGFKALCTTNLPDPAIADGSQYFDVSLWTGTGSAQSITNSSGFQPDFVWGKIRSGADYHVLANSVVGSTKFLKSNTTDAETTNAQTITSFNSDGFSVGTSTDLNRSTYTFVGWQWKAGGTGVTNTAGSITSTVSANTTAGFSIVTYTGTGANATVGHGLGVAPSMIIVKNRTTATSTGWIVYHATQGGTKFLVFNSTASVGTASTVWNDTAPTSSVFSLGSNTDVNQSSNNIVAYCFAPVEGYSAFGSFVGNGSSDGPMIYTGFKPRFLLIKSSSNAYNWVMWDSERNKYNAMNGRLFPNLSNAEDTYYSADIDFVSNGFKFRNGSDAGYNGSGVTYVYAAFAESPFKYSLAR